MKVAITTDHLLFRDHSTSILDMYCELFPEARAYVLAHKIGAVLGHLELRPIESTGLSKKVDNIDELLKKSFLIPTLSQQLRIPCSVDLMLNLSRGLSHAFKKCDQTKQITYLYDQALLMRPKRSLRERFFSGYLKKWAREGLANIDLLWVPHEMVATELAPYTKAQIEVVPPFFKLSDYPLIPSKIFKKDFYCINAQGLNLKQAQGLKELLDARQMRFRFIGIDTHLDSLKSKWGEDIFFGERCAGELAPLLAASRGLLDFEQDLVPIQSFQAQAEGLRIVRSKMSPGNIFLQNDYTETIDFEPKAIALALDTIDKNFEVDEPQKVRAGVMHYHDLKFKGALQRALKNFDALK